MRRKARVRLSSVQIACHTFRASVNVLSTYIIHLHRLRDEIYSFTHAPNMAVTPTQRSFDVMEFFINDKKIAETRICGCSTMSRTIIKQILLKR